MKYLNSADKDFNRRLGELLSRESGLPEEIPQTVERILKDVRSNGDRAILEYTSRYDGLNVQSVTELEIPRQGLKIALDSVNDELRAALQFAAKRIENYHRHQILTDWSIKDEYGAELGQRITALDKVGIYVPGGKAAYPSSVLMAAIPARLAGVKELIMTVPTPNGAINNAVLAAAALAGIDRVFKIGGAQAIAAMAYGTQTIPKVDKIVGPGNAYVAQAKRMVFGEVGIDMIAGPSEVLIVSDSCADPHWVAMDLFAQAEHDEMAQSIHVSADAAHHQAVKTAIKMLLPQQPRQAIIEKALTSHGGLILAHSDREIADIVNIIAPEHLEIMVEDPDILLHSIRHAGSIFIGRYSAEVLGDYCAGPNHVLPTSGTAKFSSPLGVYDFQKRSSIVRFRKDSVADVAETAAYLAGQEGLTAHQCSALYRVKSSSHE